MTPPITASAASMKLTLTVSFETMSKILVICQHRITEDYQYGAYNVERQRDVNSKSDKGSGELVHLTEGGNDFFYVLSTFGLF